MTDLKNFFKIKLLVKFKLLAKDLKNNLENRKHENMLLCYKDSN